VATDKPFAVNVPLLYPDIEQHMKVITEEGVKIVFTSAGNPRTWTSYLKEKGISVIHVVSSSQFAQKAEAAGCDAVVAEGFEAGGHNGREETTSFVLIPLVRNAVKIPVLAAGGIATGRQMYAAMALGAEGVQVGSRFVASVEASAHQKFKEAVIHSTEGGTQLSLKKIVPVRLLKNAFFELVNEAEMRGASKEELQKILGSGRSKKGMFEGNLEDGELEIGQVSSMIRDILPAKTIIRNLWSEFEETMQNPL
jgi:enoyl-[acyl-carrier protein] reductase II